MAAAYAALVSLMNTVDAIPNNPCAFTSLDEYQTESLREKIDSLLQFVVDYDFRGGKTKDAVEDLKSQIGSAAHAAEVVIEAHIVDRIITHPSFYMQKMIVLMHFFINKFEEYGLRENGSIEDDIEDKTEDLKTKIKSAAHTIDVMISDEAKEYVQGSSLQGIIKEAIEDVLYFLWRFHDCTSQLSECSHMIIEEMGSLIDKKMIEVKHSLIEDFEDYNSHGGLTKEALEYLESQIESLAHAVDVIISDGAKESVQKDPTQGITNEPVEDLKTRIASAASAAESVLNSVKDLHFHRSRISEQSQKIREEMDFLMKKAKYVKEQRKHEEQSLDLQKILEDMGFLIDKVNNVKEQMEHEYQKPTDSMPTDAPSRSYSTTGNMVGFDGYKGQLLDRLTGNQSERQVISITGMGGIGKTTLARNVYDDKLIVQHFDKRAWVTISQEYRVREILVEILLSVGRLNGGLDEKSENELGEELHKILFCRRYLIILDDMWGIDAWEKLHFFFPNQEERSRIVVTSRQSDMVKYFGASALVLSFLEDDKSWQLFSEKVFAYEDCPPELEGIGRKIVKKCRGLPLSIAVIGGLLQKSSRVQEYWENVEKDMSSIVNSAEENLCSDILSLSYNHLPTSLKPCFLYLGIFPEDTEIPVTRLVRLWVVEGFLKPNKDQSLEEVGEGYVKDLQDRNLIVVQRPFRNYSVKTFCKVHDLLRELCIRTAEKEKFFCVMSGLDTSRHIDREGLSVFHKIILRNQGYPFQALSLSVRGETQHQNCELWRVVFNHAFTKSIWEQVSLRYSEGNIPGHPLRWNLQTYMDRKTPFIKYSLHEIWEMTQLRHVEARRIHLPDPPSGDNHDRIVLENLQTLGKVENFKCSEEVCKRMPNIKKLSIQYRLEDEVIGWSTQLNYISNVCSFNKLESLKYSFVGHPNRYELLHNLKFPKSLKKLRLEGCVLHWDDLTIIGSLPHLEVLKLDDDAVQGPEWNPIENQFRSLKSLKVKSFDLIYWNADSSHFPILEKLTLQTPKLNEIPEDIGEIPTLTVIFLRLCGASVAISELNILKLQEDSGNNDIKVFVYDKEEILKKVREWVELECISTDNVRLIEY